MIFRGFLKDLWLGSATGCRRQILTNSREGGELLKGFRSSFVVWKIFVVMIRNIQYNGSYRWSRNHNGFLFPMVSLLRCMRTLHPEQFVQSRCSCYGEFHRSGCRRTRIYRGIASAHFSDLPFVVLVSPIKNPDLAL